MTKRKSLSVLIGMAFCFLPISEACSSEFKKTSEQDISFLETIDQRNGPERDGLILEHAYPFFGNELIESPTPVVMDNFILLRGIEIVTEGLFSFIFIGGIFTVVLLFAGYVFVN